MARFGEKVSRSEVSSILKNTFSFWNFLMKPASYIFSGPNWLYGAFGGKIVPDENFAQFCLKSHLKFVFPKNTFSIWNFVLNRTSLIFSAKRTIWHICGQKVSRSEVSSILKNTFSVGIFCWNRPHTYFSGPNWLYGAFGGKIVPDENFAQFCLKSPLKFIFPKKTFSIWIFVLNRTSPIFLAKQTRWHDWGQRCPGAKFRSSLKIRFRLEFVDETGPRPLF